MTSVLKYHFTATTGLNCNWGANVSSEPVQVDICPKSKNLKRAKRNTEQNHSRAGHCDRKWANKRQICPIRFGWLRWVVFCCLPGWVGASAVVPCHDFWWTTTFSEPVVTGNFTGPSGLPGHVRHEPCRAIPLRAADEVQLMARRSALKMHVLEVGAAEDWALDDPVNRLFPTSKHVEYDWNDEPI